MALALPFVWILGLILCRVSILMLSYKSIEMLLVRLSISSIFFLIFKSCVPCDGLETSKSFDRFGVDIHIFHSWRWHTHTFESLASPLLEDLHLLLMLLNAHKHIVNQDIFVRCLRFGWLLGLNLILNLWCLFYFYFGIWTNRPVFNWVCIISWLIMIASCRWRLLFSPVHFYRLSMSVSMCMSVSMLMRSDLLIFNSLRLWWIVNELAPHSIWTVTFRREFLAKLRFVIWRYLCLYHYISFGVSKGTSIPIFACPIDLKSLAHFCSKLMNMWCRWCEVVA